jgi:hypothetical protein
MNMIFWVYNSNMLKYVSNPEGSTLKTLNIKQNNELLLCFSTAIRLSLK